MVLIIPSLPQITKSAQNQSQMKRSTDKQDKNYFQRSLPRITANMMLNSAKKYFRRFAAWLSFEKAISKINRSTKHYEKPVTGLWNLMYLFIQILQIKTDLVYQKINKIRYHNHQDYDDRHWVAWGSRGTYSLDFNPEGDSMSLQNYDIPLPSNTASCPRRP
jgi:hypothetical protein